jgi:hypothetical protein
MSNLIGPGWTYFFRDCTDTCEKTPGEVGRQAPKIAKIGISILNHKDIGNGYRMIRSTNYLSKTTNK